MMNAYNVILLNTDYPYLVIAESLAEVEQKLENALGEKGDILEVKDLRYMSDCIVY